MILMFTVSSLLKHISLYVKCDPKIEWTLRPSFSDIKGSSHNSWELSYE